MVLFEESSWRLYGASSLPPVLKAALACFVEQGYHGTSIRAIATRSQLSVPGLYHHYPSKQGLLVDIMARAMADLWARSCAALAEAGSDPLRRLDLLVECLVLFHAHQRDLAFIAYNEIRALEGDARQEHIAARDRQQTLIDQILGQGVEEARFSTPHLRETSRAVTTMCTGVSQWYRPGGPLSPDELATIYRSIARRAVGAETSG